MNTKKLSYWKVWSFKTRIYEKHKKANYTIMFMNGTLKKHIFDTDKQTKQDIIYLWTEVREKSYWLRLKGN